MLLFGVTVGIVVVVLILILSFLWIFALIDIIVNKRLSDTEKILWFIVVLFSHFFGALLYLIFGRK